MPITRTYINFYKTIVVILLLAFSLSPCSVKRDVLGIFDIQHLSTLNKVKTTVSPTANCDTVHHNFSSKTSISKADFKFNEVFSFKLNSVLNFSEDTVSQNKYSGTTSGNSPPKYILFKQLRLNLV
ncbi:hypothetical protein [Chryseobacterium limigenitum]|uniref:Uncharacterized protein n=1 Tax=Chryseobacterium limigenitum TaxID=1612149 RepID=A0A1K2IQ83_9FLAO|nr:hypothetical protein [Chryseobacterium limigenitum]SFZ94613.1 hypothetical protein SAMN05216324_10797 [Chryseobacterium limigenitum]